MDIEKFIKTGTLFNVLQLITQSSATDTVTITIRRVSDSYTWNFTSLAFASATSTGTMTVFSGKVWKSTFTPPTNDTYVISIYDTQVDETYYQFLESVGLPEPASYTAPTDGYLINISDIRNFTGITDVSVVSNADISFYIQNNEAMIFQKAGLKFFDTQITEKYDGDDSDTLVLDHAPVRTVDTLLIDSSAIPSSCYLFYADKNTIFLKDGTFPSRAVDRQNISVTYTYGIPAAEDLYKFRVARKICLYTTSKDVYLQAGVKSSNGVQSERLGDYSLTWGAGGPYSSQMDIMDKMITECWATLGNAITMVVL